MSTLLKTYHCKLIFMSPKLTPVLLCNQLICAVLLAEGRFFNFAGGISRNVCEDNFLRSLISWKSFAEFFDFFLCDDAIFYNALKGWLADNDVFDVEIAVFI